MPSLKKQLSALKTAESRSLGVEREHQSLLFDYKEAASFTSEEYFHLGNAGINDLRALDRAVADYEPELFNPSTITLNRVTLSQEANDKLNKSLDRMIIYLSPYFHHRACKQVLEWLIHKFHIHLYNAETMANAFLLYYHTKTFGRLLKILRLESAEWEFTKEFAAQGLPLDFATIVKSCYKGGGNYFLIASYSNFLKKAIALTGEGYVEQKMEMHFTFFTALVDHLLEDPAKINENFLSRVMPFVGEALKSKILPFKLSGCTIVVDLVSQVTLADELIRNILKLLILKMRSEWFPTVMETLFVVCQRQSVDVLPKKATMKLLRRAEEFGLEAYLDNYVKSDVDMTKFNIPFVKTIFALYSTETDSNGHQILTNFAKIALNLDAMDSSLATNALKDIFVSFISEDGTLSIPAELTVLFRQIVIRFCEEFDQIRAEIEVSHKELLRSFLDQCNIGEHEIGVLNLDGEAAPKEGTEDVEMEIVDEVAVRKKPKRISAKEQMSAAKNGMELPKSFKSPPNAILELLKEDADNKNISWALAAFDNPNYISKQTQEALEDYALEIIRYISTNPKTKLRSALKVSLNKVPLDISLWLNLISPIKHEVSTPKRGRTIAATNYLQKIFGTETDEEFELRLVLVFELMISSDDLKGSAEMLRKLFALVEVPENRPDDYPVFKTPLIIQQLSLILLLKLLRSSDVSSLVDKTMNFDALVNIIRSTHDQAVLRNSLQILTAVAPFIPGRLTSQIMSLFAFVGDGLMRKDNELTLMIVDETLQSLLSSVLNLHSSNRKTYRQHLFTICQIFGTALPDIPAHRRVIILRTLIKTVHANELWIAISTIFASICSLPNRSKDNPVEEIILEIVSDLLPQDQFSLVLDIIDHLISLGGDDQNKSPKRKVNKDFPVIFDAAKKQTAQLKHYRYALMLFALKMTGQKLLLEQLADLNDEEIYETMAETGKRMMETLAVLSEFITAELSAIELTEKSAQSAASANSVRQSLKYWNTMWARAELRCMLPANIAGHIICDLLDKKNLTASMRDRALRLLNVKLVNEQVVTTGDGIDLYLIKLARKLNSWIIRTDKADEIVRCQRAAFTLKLLAKRLNSDDCREIFAETMLASAELLKGWRDIDQAMLGNVLLLVGELVRSQSVRSSVAEYIDLACEVCLAILKKAVEDAPDHSDALEQEAEETAKIEQGQGDGPNLRKLAVRRRRVRTQSMSGKQYGDDSLFICSLTTSLRILSNTSVPKHIVEFMSSVCQLSGYYLAAVEDDNLPGADKRPPQIPSTIRVEENATQKLATIRHRLGQIRKVMAEIDLAEFVEYLGSVVTKLNTRPMALGSCAQLLELAIEVNHTRTNIFGALVPYLVPIFFEMLNLRHRVKKALLENIDRCEVSVCRSFVTYAEHLSEQALGPVFADLAEWVETGIKLKSAEKDRWRLITVYHFANRFYEHFNTLALPQFSQLYAYTPKLLIRLNASKTEPDELLINGVDKDSRNSIMADQLITLLVDFIDNCAKNRQFMGDDRAELVYEAVLDELENRKVEGHESRCVDHLANCIYHLGESAPDLFTSSLCFKLLEKLRSTNQRVRYRTLLVFEKLIVRIGDALAPILPTVVQYLSEALEDTIPKIAEQCDKTMRQLRTVFGNEMMDDH